MINASKLHTEKLVYGIYKASKDSCGLTGMDRSNSWRQPWKRYYQNCSMCTPEKNLNTPRKVHPLIKQGRSYYLVEIPILYMMRCLFSWKLCSIFLPTTEKPSSKKLLQDLFHSDLLCWLKAEMHHWCTAFKGAILHYHTCRVKSWLIQTAKSSFRMMVQNRTPLFALDQLAEQTRICTT